MSLDVTIETIVRRVVREELQSMSQDDRLLTAEEVSEVLGLKGAESVSLLVREGKLKRVDLGEKRKRYRNSEVQQLIKDLAA